MPLKSPTSPTRPKFDRSRFGEGIELKVMAVETWAKDAKRTLARIEAGSCVAGELSQEKSFIADRRSADCATMLFSSVDGCAQRLA
jgi:hypothetical protein